jgi:hypothetical protein
MVVYAFKAEQWSPTLDVDGSCWELKERRMWIYRSDALCNRLYEGYDFLMTFHDCTLFFQDARGSGSPFPANQPRTTVQST